MCTAFIYSLFAQGFASGDAEEDAFAIRKFVSDGHHIFLAQSFAKVRHTLKFRDIIQYLSQKFGRTLAYTEIALVFYLS